ncbi:MAG: helix-hairpin-helix domain-containing protein [Chitinophagaceae bacterium]|nr:helix-hairpin-helix domain-containing protein [Chitinophagaceae bacterium]
MINKFCISFIFLFAILAVFTAHAQQVPATTEQQLEDLTSALESETEDDAYLQQLQYYREHPLNINTATTEELQAFKFITDLQIQNLLQYRRLLGKFISIYEVQAVPTWNTELIRRLLPFVTVSTTPAFADEFVKRISSGNYTAFLRNTRILEKSKGFDTSGTTHYLGSRDHLFFRFQYRYKNLLQYSVVADKDAGEQFFKGSQKNGFDFYSFYFFARQFGVVKALALGDFTVNMGQGLIQWQSLAFKKSSEVLAIKRQGPVINPYHSAGEFNFNRGAGVTIKKNNFEATAFVSMRNVSTNVAIDTFANQEVFTSFLTSGLHRTTSEIEDKNSTQQLSYGNNITYNLHHIKIAVNAVTYQFSKALQKRNEPYNFFAVTGKQWLNASTDYSFTYKNIHLFGEAAIDKNFDKGFVQGALISVDSKVDVSLLYRHISAAYQSLYGNAFTENVMPTDESGFYTGISMRPFTEWRVDAYTDFFKFPYLKYRVDAPSYGHDYLIQLTYQPSKQFELYSRFKTEQKQINQANSSSVMHTLVVVPKQNWRIHFSYRLNQFLAMRSRTEILWYDKNRSDAEQGFLTYLESIYEPKSGLTTSLRLQYFETDSYNSRIYAYENDVLYSYSIPAFYDKGFRYYFNVSADAGEKFTFWLRLAQTIYSEKNTIGSRLDEIKGNKRSEIKVQVRYVF